MKRVYLIQAEITSGPANEHYLPFSVGCIWAYANQFEEIKNNFELCDVIWRRDRQRDVLDKIEDPDIVGFSTYVWNHNWNLTLAKKVKQRWPNCLIVFGGPSINEDWLVHDFIDVAMFGEGEEAWASLLKKYLAGDALERYWNNPRQNEISDYPSPYLTGFFDKIIKENPEVSWFMMLETNRGCPYHCTFCGWGAEYLNKLKVFNLERVDAEIKWAIDNNIHWMFIIDANSGILKERDVEIAWMIRRAIETPGSKIRRVTFNHAKNLNDECFEMEKIIQKWTYGLEIAVQSMHQPTLIASKRNNMGMNNLERAYEKCRRYGIRFYTEMVLGLPLETKETYISGIIKLMELGQHDSIKTYLATVIPNSEMDSKEYRDQYGIEVIYPKDLYRSKEERKWDEEDNSDEVIAMVCATSTATRQDLADCLLYAWMLSQFHFAGFTQLVSRYLYNMKGIGYRTFYDSFYKVLKEDEVAKTIVDTMEYLLKEYLEKGEMPPEKEWDNVVALTMVESYKLKFIDEHKDHFIRLGIKTAKSLTNISIDIEVLQKAFIRDKNKEYPYIIETNLDIDRWEYMPARYEIRKREQVSHMHDQMYQKFLMKTDIINLDNPFVPAEIIKEYRASHLDSIPIIPIPTTATEGRQL